MTDIRQRLDTLIAKNDILPIKTHEGIVVGSVKIVSRDTLKDLWQYNSVVYAGISLNKVAIKLANMLARQHRKSIGTDKLYTADQEYGRLLFESLLLRERLHRARQNGEHDKADMYLARYTLAKDRATYAKKQVLALTGT